jgi:hypothetical protein
MTTKEKARLRTLAGKYAEYALGNVMSQRREKWRLHNRMEEKTYPFHIEDNGTYFRDLLPPLQCDDPECRNLESRLLRSLLAYETINDDRIVPNRFVVNWATEISNYCDELELTHATDRTGLSFGYKTNRPIQDIDADFGKIKNRTISVDAALTRQRAELAEDAFDGLLPVEVGDPGSRYSDGIANKAVLLMGMENLYLQMAANPDAVHRLLSFFARDNLSLGQWQEDEGLLTMNNDGNQGYCSGSCQYSDEIPGREIEPGEPVLSTDRYGYLEAQEAVGISPAMFGEFLMPHFSRLAEKFSLMKYGCCEGVHDLMPHLSKLNGLRKVSVTPWCDLEKLADRCSPNIIWSRKPTPLKLCDTTFNPGEFREHLNQTLEIGRDFYIEFIFRDTNRLTGEMKQRLETACAIVREVTGRPEGRAEWSEA